MGSGLFPFTFGIGRTGGARRGGESNEGAVANDPVAALAETFAIALGRIYRYGSKIVLTVEVREQVIGIAAQVSLYPLRQETLSPTIQEALRIFREHGLHVEPSAMSSLVIGDDAAVFAALHEAFRRAAEQGEVVMVTTFSNACPVSGETGEVVTNRDIGHLKDS